MAAPTTSLPEHLGGIRNWDYRFCWLRDATFTLYALLVNGYHDEASAWRDWLLRAVAGDPSQLQIMYGVGGERRLREYTIDWLPGYENSRPVRVGNAAWDQFQLDVFGEVVDTLHLARSTGLEVEGGELGASDRPHGVPRRGLETPRRRDLGGPRAAAALHALEGHGLGRLRPDRERHRAI